MVLSMDRWTGKVAVVTGASAGIGSAIVEQLVENGIHVVGLARRQDLVCQHAMKLAEKKGKLFPIKADLTNEEDILNAFKWIKENLGPVHILINNADYCEKEYLSEGDTELWNRIFQLNVIGLCIATREAVRDMKANNVDGHIFHIISIIGQQVVNYPLGVYPASKYAVTALAESLMSELNSLELRIKITNLSPGLIDTELVQRLKLKENREELYEASKIIEAENIADGVIYALSTPPHVQIQQLTITPFIHFAPL